MRLDVAKAIELVGRVEKKWIEILENCERWGKMNMYNKKPRLHLKTEAQMADPEMDLMRISIQEKRVKDEKPCVKEDAKIKWVKYAIIKDAGVFLDADQQIQQPGK